MTLHARFTDVLFQRSFERLDITDFSGSHQASVGREYADTNASREINLVVDEAPVVKVALDEAGQIVADSSALDGLAAAIDDWIRLERERTAELRAEIDRARKAKH